MIAIPNFFFIALFYLLVPKPKQGAAEAAFAELIQQGLRYQGRIRLSDYRRLVAVKTNVLLFLQGLAGNLPWGALFLLIKYLQEVRGLDVNTATTIYGIFGIGGAIGGLTGGPIFSIFNLTDAVGYGVGQFFAGMLAIKIGTAYALGISFGFWVPCGILLLIASLYFNQDVRSMDSLMVKVAYKMKSEN